VLAQPCPVPALAGVYAWFSIGVLEGFRLKDWCVRSASFCSTWESHQPVQVNPANRAAKRCGAGSAATFEETRKALLYGFRSATFCRRAWGLKLRRAGIGLHDSTPNGEQIVRHIAPRGPWCRTVLSGLPRGAVYDRPPSSDGRRRGDLRPPCRRKKAILKNNSPVQSSRSPNGEITSMYAKTRKFGCFAQTPVRRSQKPTC
jgi:hypothetical protein